MAVRRDYGAVRRLASGRWQDRFPNLTSLTRLIPARQMFATEADATAHLATAAGTAGRMAHPMSG